MRRCIDAIDAVNRGFAHLATLAALLCVLLVFVLVVARYGFAFGSVAAQDAVQWLHAALFLFALAIALAEDRHVRVDAFAARWSARRRAKIELAGLLLLLLPFTVFVLVGSYDFVAASWAMREGAREPGGLPAVYLFKSMLPLAAALLTLQALAQSWRVFLLLRAA